MDDLGRQERGSKDGPGPPVEPAATHPHAPPQCLNAHPRALPQLLPGPDLGPSQAISMPLNPQGLSPAPSLLASTSPLVCQI